MDKNEESETDLWEEESEKSSATKMHGSEPGENDGR
jgi:hypothetical protein